jgi:hypothetical protein
MSRQTFTGADVNDFPPASFTAVGGTSTAKWNLWNPALWSAIPAYDMRAGKVYVLECGGIISCVTTPTIIFEPAFGQNNSAPPTNAGLGASRTLTLGTGLAAATWSARFILGVRSLNIAASLATVVGWGTVSIQGVAAAVDQTLQIGGTVLTTADHTTPQGIALNITFGTSNAGNTVTAQGCLLRSFN